MTGLVAGAARPSFHLVFGLVFVFSDFLPFSPQNCVEAFEVVCCHMLYIFPWD